MNHFDQTIYETPPAWGGESHFMNILALNETLIDLRTVEGFEDIGVDECATLTLQAEMQLPHVRAVYEYDHTAPGHERYIVVRIAANGYYTRIGGEYKTLADAMSAVD